MTDALYPQVKRLKVNRGGEIDEAEVIGRERELDVLLRTLKQQSVLVAAERRIGKTTLCKQAQRQIAGDTLALYQDIESVEKTLDIAAVLMKMTYPHFGVWRKWQQKTSTLYQRLAEAKITLPDTLGGGGFTLPPTLQTHWKELIQNTIADLLAAQADGKHGKEYVCLFIDEFPIAVEKIRASEGDQVAMDVLDLFRSLRETHGSKLRFIFTGSIGIHHIVRRLQTQGYSNDPLNDVFQLHVRALETDAAQELALGLLLGENVPHPTTPPLPHVSPRRLPAFPSTSIRL